MNFHDKLQLLRKENGLSQEDLAENIGISRQAVAKWELAQAFPDISNLIILSNIFKVTIDSLIKPDEECGKQFGATGSHNMGNVFEFLCRAKKATYAGKGIEEAISSRPNSHDLIYEEGNRKYIDTFVGGERFTGEEGIWIEGIPKWSMNYSGRVLSDKFSGDFLKEALLLVPLEKPFRGPEFYQSGEYTFLCNVKGNTEWFQGYEEIYYNCEKVYECYYHGGIVE